MENGQLMSESQHLQFQGDAMPKPEGDQRGHCRQDREHAGHDKMVGANFQCFQGTRNYEQAQAVSVSWFDCSRYQKELFEGHPQMAKAALAEDERIRFHHLVPDDQRQCWRRG